MLHIDIANEAFVNPLCDNGKQFFTAKVSEYPNLLNFTRSFVKKYPDSREHGVCGRNIYIKFKYYGKFVKYLNKNTKFIFKKKKISKPKKILDRPEWLQNSFIQLNHAFYVDNEMDWMTLDPKKQREFTEIKDMIHEDIYGDSEILSNLNNEDAHGYISKNSEKRKQFVLEMKRAFDDIHNRVEKDGCMRHEKRAFVFR